MDINNVYDEQTLFHFVMSLFEDARVEVEVSSKRRRSPNRYAEELWLRGLPNIVEQITLEITVGDWDTGMRLKQTLPTVLGLAEWAVENVELISSQVENYPEKERE